MHSRTDQELVLACLAGEAEAHETLLGRFQVRIFSFILRLVGNQADAEDLCQQTFLKAFDALEAYDPARPLVSWLFGIAHHLVVDLLRARKPALSLDDDSEPLDFPDPGQSVERAVQAASDQETMDRLVADLPPHYREIVVLRHSEDLDYAAIGDILGLPEGTVKNRLFRARNLLKTKLEALGYAG